MYPVGPAPSKPGEPPRLFFHDNPISYEQSEVFPLRHVVVPGLAGMMPIPARAEEVLRKQYGDWCNEVLKGQHAINLPMPKSA
jgi:hypothetical protein